MRIAVLSGKGGTGKTLIAVNLSAVVMDSVYMDCDVEEPNGHLFFKPENLKEENVLVTVPECMENLCNGCRVCVDFCKYNALAFVNNKVKVFEDICHSCGGCMLLCPKKAMAEKRKKIGVIQSGFSGKVEVVTGILNPGIPSGVPIIKKIIEKSETTKKETVVLDCPPGSSCLVMESIKEADYCIIVTEPTIFGAQNLEMVHELVRIFNKPYGIILNKCTNYNDPSEAYAVKNNINIIAKLDYDSNLGIINSQGKIIVEESQFYRDLFKKIHKNLEEEVFNDEASVNSER